jgi:hypothetical protein
MGILSAIEEIRGKQREIAKAVETGTWGSTIREISFADAVVAYGDLTTPFVSALAHTQAKETTHRWRDVAVRAGSTNLGTLENAAPTERQQTPTKRSNTCQIFSGRVNISGSGIQEAANGIYGSDILDQLAWQIGLEMKGILKDVEKQILFGTEQTGSPRRFKGLIGDLGTYNGLVQTTRYSVSATAGTGTLIQNAFDEFLQTCFDQGTGFFPTDVFCNSRDARRIAGWANTSAFTYGPKDVADLANLQFPAGYSVVPYLSPFGAVKIHVHPFLTYSATVANNVLLAVNMGLLKLADFRPLHVADVARTTDGVARDLIYEASLELNVEPAHGLMYTYA